MAEHAKAGSCGTAAAAAANSLEGEAVELDELKSAAAAANSLEGEAVELIVLKVIARSNADALMKEGQEVVDFSEAWREVALSLDQTLQVRRALLLSSPHLLSFILSKK